MSEARRKLLMGRIDKEWLVQAARLLGASDRQRSTEELIKKILAIGKVEPSMLLLPLHQGTIAILMRHCGEYIETEVSPSQKESIIKGLKSDLMKVSEADYPIRHPNHAYISSASYAEILIHEGILPDLLLSWSDEVNEVISTTVIAQEFWNLINYYGVITPQDLLRMHAASHNEEVMIPEDFLWIAHGYIELNLSDEIYYEEIDGEDYFHSEYLAINAFEILEDAKAYEGDYKVVPLNTLMEMFYGIDQEEMLNLVDYITRCFDLTPEDEQAMVDVESLHALIIAARGRGAEKLPVELHEGYDWKWGVTDLEVRDLIFQEFLGWMPRYHLKGHSAYELSNDLAQEDMDVDDFEGEEWPEGFKFKLRKDPPEEDGFLN